MSAMTRAFTVYDLFAVGLALELAGAALLVRATFLSPQRIFVENALWGSPYHRVAAAARSRTESFVGFSGLLIGFLVQLAGYAVYLWHDGRAAYGREQAIVAVILALVVAPLWFRLGLIVNRIVYRPLLVRVASQRANDTTLDQPRADSLVRWGKAAGFEELPNELVPDYLRRVFKVERSLLPQVGGGFTPLDGVPPEDWPKFED
jgi:hypothetical protein